MYYRRLHFTRCGQSGIVQCRLRWSWYHLSLPDWPLLFRKTQVAGRLELAHHGIIKRSAKYFRSYIILQVRQMTVTNFNLMQILGRAVLLIPNRLQREGVNKQIRRCDKWDQSNQRDRKGKFVLYVLHFEGLYFASWWWGGCSMSEEEDIRIESRMNTAPHEVWIWLAKKISKVLNRLKRRDSRARTWFIVSWSVM